MHVVLLTGSEGATVLYFNTVEKRRMDTQMLPNFSSLTMNFLEMLETLSSGISECFTLNCEENSLED